MGDEYEGVPSCVDQLDDGFQWHHLLLAIGEQVTAAAAYMRTLDAVRRMLLVARHRLAEG